MIERDIERCLVREVEKLGGVCWKFVSPGTTGVPDRLVIMPNGKIVFVELKAECGRLAAIQKYRMKQLRALGCNARVVKGKSELIAFLNEVRCDAI